MALSLKHVFIITALCLTPQFSAHATGIPAMTTPAQDELPADTTPTPTTSRSTPETEFVPLYTVDDAVGSRISENNNKAVSRIDRVVTDSEGRAYVVIYSGGFMNMGGTRYVVPIRDIQPGKGRKEIVLLDRAALDTYAIYKPANYTAVRGPVVIHDLNW